MTVQRCHLCRLMTKRRGADLALCHRILGHGARRVTIFREAAECRSQAL